MINYSFFLKTNISNHLIDKTQSDNHPLVPSHLYPIHSSRHPINRDELNETGVFFTTADVTTPKWDLDKCLDKTQTL